MEEKEEVLTGPGAHPTSYTVGVGSFPGVKWRGVGVDHPPPSSTEVFVAYYRVNFKFPFTFKIVYPIQI